MGKFVQYNFLLLKLKLVTWEVESSVSLFKVSLRKNLVISFQSISLAW
jgi:hypothetical protein